MFRRATHDMRTPRSGKWVDQDRSVHGGRKKERGWVRAAARRRSEATRSVVDRRQRRWGSLPARAKPRAWGSACPAPRRRPPCTDRSKGPGPRRHCGGPGLMSMARSDGSDPLSGRSGRVSRSSRARPCGRAASGPGRPCGYARSPGSPRCTRPRGRTPGTAPARACGREPRSPWCPRTPHACW